MEFLCRQRYGTQSGPCMSWESVVNKLWFVISFSSQQHSKFIANIAIENVSQVCTNKCKAGYFHFQVNFNFLRSPKHFNCDTAFVVIVSFLKESFHSFNNIRNGKKSPGSR